MFHKFAAVILLLAPTSLLALDTEEFVSSFCSRFDRVVDHEKFWLINIQPDNPLYGCYAEMGSATPNISFDGKQWRVDKQAEVTLSDIIKSFVIYNRILLLPEDGIKEDIYAETLRSYGFLWTSEQPPLNAKTILQSLFEQLKEKNIPRSQDYFADGPLFNKQVSKLEVPENSQFHQYSSIYGKTLNLSGKVNGIGVWGDAISSNNGGKVWGGFFTSNSGNAVDSQLVGIEVDVINHGKPGRSPNESKVGMQLVSIGSANNSAAVEILSDHRARWQNGILFQDGAISSDGAAIAIANKENIRYGIDASNQQFSDAAILLSKRSRIVMRGDKLDTFIYGDEFDNGYLVLGGGGIRFVTHNDRENILKISEDGTIDTSSLVVQKYIWILLGIVFLPMICVGMNVYLFIKLRKS